MSRKAEFFDPITRVSVISDPDSTDQMEYYNPEFSGTTKSVYQFLNTYELNRLSFLRQSGFVFLEYPSSTHTRFSHSVACCHLGQEALNTIQIEIEDVSKDESSIKQMGLGNWLQIKGWKEEFLLALLLHDIGHFPFSHTLESNLEFWECFEKEEKFSHEELTCLLINGNKNDKKPYKSFKLFMDLKLKEGNSQNLDCAFVCDLMEATKAINADILCYFITGKPEYLSKLDAVGKFEVDMIHHLVSGLLDLDRIDHYRRDAFFSGLLYGSNLNVEGLLRGMLLHYYTGGESSSFEIRLSDPAIGFALELLQTKEKLIDICFEDRKNIAYDAMLHRAINLYLGVYKLDGGKFDNHQLTKAFELFFLSDDELLGKLFAEGSTEVKSIVLRIRNRKHYDFVAKAKINPSKYSLKKIRRVIANKSKLEPQDIILRPSKHFGATKKFNDEWLNLELICNSSGKPLSESETHKAAIKGLQQKAIGNPNTIWFYESDRTRIEKVKDAIRQEFQKEDQE